MRLFSSKKKKQSAAILAEGGVWFVDIPRTGSTSIKFVLERELGSAYGKSYYRPTKEVKKTLFLDHTVARNVMAKVGGDVWGSIYTFTFVRNPWDRFHSLYQYRIRHGDLDGDVSFKDYVSSLRVPRYRDSNSPFNHLLYHMSMCDFLMNARGEILVQDVFKFEQREEAIEVLRKKTGIDFSGEWRESTKGEISYRDAYDDEMIQIVADCYADDIENFGYSF